MKTENRHMRAAKYRYRSLFKNLGLLGAVCLVMKLFLSFGGEEATLSLLSGIAEDDAITTAILEGELSYDRKETSATDILHSQSAFLQGYDAPTEESSTKTASPQSSPAPSMEMESSLPEAKDPAAETTVSAPLDLSEIDLSDYINDDDIKNRTSYEIDVKSIVQEPLSFTIDPEEPQILIIHTHGSEAYTPDGEDTYVESDPMRTENCEQNVVRIGTELQKAFESYGITALHDTSLYDYPSYNGSYNRSMESINAYLSKYPDIKMVIDLHRDAVDTSGDNPYVTTAQVDGQTASQVLMIIGTDYSGLEHPDWQENLRLGLYLQSAMNYEYPGLTRPLKISEYRYNQQATHGSLILEVGYCTNTLQQALTAVKAFAKSASDVLLTYAVEG